MAPLPDTFHVNEWHTAIQGEVGVRILKTNRGRPYANHGHDRPDGRSPIDGKGAGHHRRAGGDGRQRADACRPWRVQKTGADATGRRRRPWWVTQPARWRRPTRPGRGAATDRHQPGKCRTRTDFRIERREPYRCPERGIENRTRHGDSEKDAPDAGDARGRLPGKAKGRRSRGSVGTLRFGRRPRRDPWRLVRRRIPRRRPRLDARHGPRRQPARRHPASRRKNHPVNLTVINLRLRARSRWRSGLILYTPPIAAAIAGSSVSVERWPWPGKTLNVEEGIRSAVWRLCAIGTTLSSSP